MTILAKLALTTALLAILVALSIFWSHALESNDTAMIMSFFCGLGCGPFVAMIWTTPPPRGKP